MPNIHGEPMDTQVEKILECFNFSVCLLVMQFLNWKIYHGSEEESRISTIKELQAIAAGLLKSVSENAQDNYYEATAGLWAEKKGGELSLRFVLEEYGVNL